MQFNNGDQILLSCEDGSVTYMCLEGNGLLRITIILGGEMNLLLILPFIR